MTETTTAASADNPGVIVWPPLLYGGALIVVLILRAVWPMPIVAATTVWLGLAFVVIGLAIMATGRRTMTAAGTNVNPSRPATTIVSSGPFRFTRNPLYVGVTLIFGGLTLAFNTWWGFIVLVPVLITMHFGVVLREERYLERKFGEPYRQYRSRVRRYF
ncbi:MAG: isoprenylcysteine carboxylmethyltransferase family protein [Acidobacteria bacterium]|nr:MAG: isoprenylcysteine carboxylmethyltransferase family protein [Acidobacteriota bacterium]